MVGGKVFFVNFPEVSIKQCFLRFGSEMLRRYRYHLARTFDDKHSQSNTRNR